tara:strand:+ start:1332 stop:1925 length:594 start_codon:yes stop_codon:yes gene_type:complete
MTNPMLSREENLFDFFHAAVDAAVVDAPTAVSKDGVYYLTNLLVERGRTPDEPQVHTLVDLQIMAQERGGAAAVQAWREMGDRALYISGFFRASLARQNISPDYYLSMGSAAYDQLACLMRWTGAGGGFENIYEELAQQFEFCASILQRVRDRIRSHTNADIVKLYEQWVLDPDPVTAQQLHSLGVIPMRPEDDGAC